MKIGAQGTAETSPMTGIRRSELAAAAELAGTDFRVTDPDLASDGVALRGDYRLVSLRSGLVLHATDTHDVHDLTTQIVQRPGITCSLFLKGDVNVSLGDRSFAFGQRGAVSYSHLEGVIVARTRPETFVRRSRRGAHIRKVNVTISPEWLERDGLQDISAHATVARFGTDHLGSLRWHPSMRLVSLAEQILRPPAYAPLLQGLYLESRAIEIVAEALHVIAQTPPETSAQRLRPRAHQRILELRELLDTKLEANFTLDEVARDAGMSVNTLQRLFHAVHGMTVFEYVRMRKLERARDALEQEGVSVAEAAYLAGYTSAANFSTAFKRAFGASPKSFRALL